MKKLKLLVWILGLMPLWCLAQPFTLDEKVTPMRLDLQPHGIQKGQKGITVQGVTIENGHHFYVKGHGMFQPIDVILEAPGTSNMGLGVFYTTWNSPALSASTMTNGIATLKLMTYGEFGIHVANDQAGVPYLLTVYASAEKPPEFNNPFVALNKPLATAAATDVTTDVTADTTADPASKDTKTLLYVIIGLLIVIAGLLGTMLARRGKSTHLAILLLPSLLWHSDTSVAVPTNTAEGYGQDNIRLISPPEQPTSAEGWSGMTSQEADKVWEGGVKTLEYLKKLKESAKAWELYQSLDTCMRISAPPSTPEIPSFCAEPVLVLEADGIMEYALRPNQNCAQCFSDARLAFNQARLDLEKLRVIYSCTKKMSDAAISAGDGMSGIHGYSGIIWQGMRLNIVKSVDNMEKAYDTKYPELINKLHSAMIEMSICEAKFGTEDWYDRFGFVYYEFMKDSYKRKD